LAMAPAAIGAIENRKVRMIDVRRAFDGHSSNDDVIGLCDLFLGKTEVFEQGKAWFRRGSGCLEPRHGCFAEHPGGKRLRNIENARKLPFDVAKVLFVEPPLQQARSVDMG